jgi:ankyrin repeat protein
MNYTTRSIFDYTEDEMNKFLENVGDTNSYPLNEKRYMVVYYLMVNNLFSNDKYTLHPKFSEYLLDSSTWEEFKKIYLMDKLKEFKNSLKNKDTNLAKSILENNPELIEYRNNGGRTALMHSCLYGNTEIVKYLLKTGKSHPEYQNKHGETALMHASLNGFIEIVKLLLDTKKSHPEYRDNKGWKASMMALDKDHNEIVKLLIK